MEFFTTLSKKRCFSPFSVLSLIVTLINSRIFGIYAEFHVWKCVFHTSWCFYKIRSWKDHATVTRRKIDDESNGCAGLIYSLWRSFGQLMEISTFLAVRGIGTVAPVYQITCLIIAYGPSLMQWSWRKSRINTFCRGMQWNLWLGKINSQRRRTEFAMEVLRENAENVTKQ